MADIGLFGKDHWSTFAYIETRCVDHKGVPDRNHMRTDRDRHPALAGNMALTIQKKYPTLARGCEIPDHDD